MQTSRQTTVPSAERTLFDRVAAGFREGFVEEAVVRLDIPKLVLAHPDKEVVQDIPAKDSSLSVDALRARSTAGPGLWSVISGRDGAPDLAWRVQDGECGWRWIWVIAASQIAVKDPTAKLPRVPSA